MHLILIVVSALVTAVPLGWGGLAAGALLGYCLAEILCLKKRLHQLENKLAALPGAARERPDQAAAEMEVKAQKKPKYEKIYQAPFSPPRPVEEEVVFSPASEQEQNKTQPAGGRHSGLSDDTSSFVSQLFTSVINFFTKGNPVIKIGFVILFFGIAFLLKYAVDRSLLSIGTRLLLTAAVGVSFIALGWRLRNKPLGSGLALQGGGVGILYLTTFAAAKFYDLIPMSWALVVLVMLVMFSGFLALMQNGRILAAMGAVGGFLAPVLMSTGTGDHVLLFSYYAALNIGIFAIALFKTWRELNLIGFFFTFGIGSYWILDRYTGADFSTTEPFLVLFFLLYVGIAILFALKQTVHLKGVIDGPIVFGTPLVASLQQYELVGDTEYGMAISVLAGGIFYLLSALFLRRRGREGARVLSEAFLALGVTGVSLAIPLAFDGRVTAAAWALEGAALVWVGVLQSRQLARVAGLLLQFGAGFIFLDTVFYPFGSTPYLNYYFLGSALIGTSGLFSSYWLTRKKDVLKDWEHYLAWPVLIWSMSWWYFGGIRESSRHFEYLRDHNALILFATALTMLLSRIAKQYNWRQLAVAQCQFLPVLLFCGVIGLTAEYGFGHLFGGMGGLVWGVAIFYQYRMLHQFDLIWPRALAGYWHAAGFWLIILLVCHESSWYLSNLLAFPELWSLIVWGVLPALALLTLIRWGGRLSWPVQRLPEYYFGIIPLVTAVSLIVWLIYSLGNGGEGFRWGWLPVANVLELSQIFVFLSLLGWQIACHKGQCSLLDLFKPEWLRWLSAICAFLWANSVVARTVHHWLSIPYEIEPLYQSVVFQAAIASLWSIVALAVTLWSSRSGNRGVWICGAGLLGCVVLKLFAIDLSGTETVARIVSFLVVGALMLVIGYFSPMPPAREGKIHNQTL